MVSYKCSCMFYWSRDFSFIAFSSADAAESALLAMNAMVNIILNLPLGSPDCNINIFWAFGIRNWRGDLWNWIWLHKDLVLARMLMPSRMRDKKQRMISIWQNEQKWQLKKQCQNKQQCFWSYISSLTITWYWVAKSWRPIENHFYRYLCQVRIIHDCERITSDLFQ